MTHTKIVIGFVVAWLLLLLVVFETNLRMARVLLPMLTMVFIGYLLVATVLYLFSTEEPTGLSKEKPKEEELEVAELADEEESSNGDKHGS